MSETPSDDTAASAASDVNDAVGTSLGSTDSDPANLEAHAPTSEGTVGPTPSQESVSITDPAIASPAGPIPDVPAPEPSGDAAANLPPTPTITDVRPATDPPNASYRISGTSGSAGTITVYDGDKPVATTTAVMPETAGGDYTWTVFVQLLSQAAGGDSDTHVISACIYSDNESSDWASPVSIRVSSSGAGPDPAPAPTS